MSYRDEVGEIYRYMTDTIAIRAAVSHAASKADAEIAELRRDAERYRWLRLQEVSPAGSCVREIAVHLHDWARTLDPSAPFNVWAYERLTGDKLDSAIDTARGGE